jgi:hypothetical protein
MSAMGDDRLSDLPDCLLHSILSLLKARQVVQTCVLSRRWEHIWRSVPCLDIDHRDLGSSVELFEEFADNLLARRCASSPLDTFRLNAGPTCCTSSSSPCRWIRRAFKYHSPAVVDVRGGASHRVVLRPLLPGPHRLARLHLHNACLLEGHDAQGQLASALASGFPVLQALELRNCSYWLRRIESSSLKSLTIHSCHNNAKEDVVIAAPRLASLRLGILFNRERRHRRYLQLRGGGFTVSEAPSLVDASISVVDCVPSTVVQSDQISLQTLALFGTLRKLLGSLAKSTVISLELSGFKATVSMSIS